MPSWPSSLALAIAIAIALAQVATGSSAQSVRIVVQSSPLAGYQYHEGPALWQQLRVGDTLTLARETDNAHDAKAISVNWRGRKLGYLPRAENSVVAAEMDRGSRVAARIERLRDESDPWSRVRVEVYVEL